VAHESDHEQVEPAIFDQDDDRLGHVTGDEMGLDLYPGSLRLVLCRADDGGEAMVCFVLFFGDLINARGKAR